MRPHLGFKGLALCLVLIVQNLLSSCGYIALSRRTQFVSPTENTTISIAEKEDGPYEVITSDKNKIKLNHFKKSYFIKVEKESHVSYSTQITRTSTNRLKKLDIALLITSGVMSSIFVPLHFIRGTNSSFGNGSVSLPQTVLMYTNLGVGLAAWGAVIPAPGRIFPKKIDLPELIEIRTRDTNQLSLTAGQHEFSLAKRGVKVHDYPAMKQYQNGYGYELRDSVEEYQGVAKGKLYETINDLLKKAEYGVDSTKATLDGTLSVDSKTLTIIYITAENRMRCEVRTSWALETLDELQYLYDKTFNGTSEWQDYDEEKLDEEGKRKIMKEAFTEALDVSLKRFLALDTVQSILSNPVPIPLMEEEELEINTGARFATSVSDAVRSVVTVVTNEGHGSGCVITSDGYIITNAHVVEDDTTELMAIMGEDVEKKIPLKFIRMNEAVDLALLKLDTTGLTPLKLATADEIQTGADAYAIGTPADVDLGQTVTRGIGSGKRKFGGHQLIQTDVPISSGNSGGALIRPDGLLMGIVTSEMRSRRVDDIGFAVPSTSIEESLKLKINQ